MTINELKAIIDEAKKEAIRAKFEDKPDIITSKILLNWRYRNMDPLTKTMRFVITLSAHKHYEESSTIEVLYQLTDRIRTAGADWIMSAVIRRVLIGMIEDLKPSDYDKYNISESRIFDIAALYTALVNYYEK